MEAGERQLRAVLQASSSEFGFDARAIDTIIDNAQIAYFRPGATIDRANQVVGISKILFSGVVRMMFQGHRAEPMIVRFVKAGQSVTSVFERGERQAFSAVAHTHCGIGFVAHEVIVEVFSKMTRPQAAAYQRASWRLFSGLLTDKCQLLTASVRERLLFELGNLASDFGKPHPQGVLIDLALTQEDLAHLVVSDRSTLNRKLKELEGDELVFRSGDRYIIALDAMNS